MEGRVPESHDGLAEPTLDDAQAPGAVPVGAADSDLTATTEGGVAPAFITMLVEREQATRTRNGMLGAAIVSLLCALALQLTVKKTAVHWVLTAVVLAVGVLTGATAMQISRTGGIPPRRQLIVAQFGMLAGLAATAHLGILSPVPGMMTFAVFYNAQTDDRITAKTTTATACLGYALLVGLSVAGVLPLTDAVIGLTKQNNRALIGFGVAIEAFYLVAYWSAIRNRAATRDVMTRLERARTQIHKRDALLLEARADLSRVLDGARLGRFTGHDLGGFVPGEIIGRGTMSEVYEATRPSTGERAAIKVLHSYLLDDSEVVDRFLREAKLCGDLDSPHVVRILADGRADDGSPYLVMEHLAGKDLAKMLRDKRTLGEGATLELVLQVATGLASAQEAGIVHRDLKPQNLFHAEVPGGRGVWKILDFGVAAIGTSAGELTQGAAIGTPGYMSPEQARGLSVDHRSDVFALGAIAYRSITGRPAFAAPDAMATLYHVMHLQPARPSELVRVHEDVDLVLALALAKRREKRLRSAPTFAAALRDAFRGDLDPAFREAARGILANHGWGVDDSGA